MRIPCLIFSVSLISLSVSAENESVDHCKPASDYAFAVMTYYQKGGDLSDQMQRISEYSKYIRETLEIITIDAFKQSRFSSDAYRIEAAQDFKNKWYLICHQANEKYGLDANENKQTTPADKSLASNAASTGLVLRSDWGNDIQAVVTTSPCIDEEFKTQGFNYAVDSSIPVYKTKQPSDAYYVSQGRAYTVQGCWYKREDGLIHAKMRRKHDNKVWETNLNLNDGSWK